MDKLHLFVGYMCLFVTLFVCLFVCCVSCPELLWVALIMLKWHSMVIRASYMQNLQNGIGIQLGPSHLLWGLQARYQNIFKTSPSVTYFYSHIKPILSTFLKARLCCPSYIFAGSYCQSSTFARSCCPGCESSSCCLQPPLRGFLPALKMQSCIRLHYFKIG